MGKLVISATHVKEWFQYQCERKLVFSTLRADGEGEDRPNVPKLKPDRRAGLWAEGGNVYEEERVDRIPKDQVLRPSRRGEKLSLSQTLEFLREANVPSFAAQARLEVDWKAGDLQWFVPPVPGVDLSATYPDLLEFRMHPDGSIEVVVIDVKYSQVARMFHRVQVAYYAILLEAILRKYELQGFRVAERGEIWHRQGEEDNGRSEFPLAPYKRQVRAFFEGVVARLGVSSRGFDPWEHPDHHVYFRCEQCPYFDQVAEGETSCEDSLLNPVASARDVSAVPGFRQSSKRTLRLRGLETVGRFANASLRNRHWCEEASWELRRIWDRQVDRARALVDNKAFLRTGERTFSMPAHVDEAIYLLADGDPVEGNLVTVGCRLVSSRGADEHVRAIIDPHREREAIVDVFTRVLGRLERIHAHNLSDEQKLRAHLFVYEGNELRNLAEALRRLAESDPELSRSMSHILRLIPPVSANREAGYARLPHLPVTVVRHVIESVYALPVTASLDLARVTQALADHPGDLARLDEPYRPGTVTLSRKPRNASIPRQQAFEHKLSAQLAIDVLRSLRELGTTAEDEDLAKELGLHVKADVRSRLRSLESLHHAINAHHEAVHANGQGFLLLEKDPFQFYAEVGPFERNTLNVLRMQHRYEAQVAEVEALDAIARPHERRVRQGSCIGPLRYTPGRERREGWAVWVEFDLLDPRARNSDLFRESAFSVILHDDSDDTRLDREAWRDVRIADFRAVGRRVAVKIGVRKRKSVFASLEDGVWFLDQVVFSDNANRLDDFLATLSQAMS